MYHYLRRPLLAGATAVVIVATAPTFITRGFAQGTGLSSGQASGTFSVGAKSAKLTHAAALVDEEDKRLYIMLSDIALPSANWKSHLDLMMWTNDTHRFFGLVFKLNSAREVLSTEYYDGSSLPTATSGLFDLTLTSPPGKTIAGSAKSTADGEKERTPLKLDVSFTVTMK